MTVLSTPIRSLLCRTLTRLFLCCLIPCFAVLVRAAYPSGFSEVLVASTLSSPTAMAFAPDGRLFVCQQSGALRVIKNGTLLGTPFLTVGVNSSGERGLLGVAFDPDFANNNFVYIYYTATSPTVHNRVSRFTANGDVSTGTEDILMDLETLSATNHNGGAIHFGSDGMLYIATGENAVTANAQSFNNRLGKILRINSDGSIPLNPFDPQTSGLNKAIWAMGLRNPFTFNFHPGNGRMHINDVGAGAWEEVNEGIPGANYGWSFHEGFGGAPTYNDPLVAYHHSNGTPTGRAITGGAFYTGTSIPDSLLIRISMPISRPNGFTICLRRATTPRHRSEPTWGGVRLTCRYGTASFTI